MCLPLFLTACLLTTTALAKPPFDRTAWRQDYAQLKRELVERYVNLAWKGSRESGIDLPTLDQKTLAALASASDDAQAADAIRAFVDGFHDGHLSEVPYLEPASGRAAEPEAPALDGAQPATGCAALGYASTGQTAFSLPIEGLPGFKLVSDGFNSTFRTGTITRAGVTLGLVRIHNFRARAFVQACLHAWEDLRQTDKTFTPDALRDAAQLRWFADLATAIADLRQVGATALVVDIGNNSGGDDSGDWTARLLTSKPVRSARLFMVDAPVSRQYFADQIEEIDAALALAKSAEAKAALADARSFFTRQTAAIGRQRCDLSWVWRERRRWSSGNCRRLIAAGYAGGYAPGLTPKAFDDAKAAIALSSPSLVERFFGAWNGPTFVLADKRSYSSAEMFAAVMQDNGIAKLVGSRTGGDGCGFMADGEPIVLHHSRLRFRVPNCMRLRADGTNEEAGITPDLPVLATEGESARARGERALRLIVDSVGG